jgi:hypothetical protein
MPDSTPHDPEPPLPKSESQRSDRADLLGQPAMRTSIDAISLCGCYIETMFTMEIGTKLDLVLWLNDEKITAKSVVVTKYPQLGNGIDFVEMRPEDRLKLNRYIATCEQGGTSRQ